MRSSFSAALLVLALANAQSPQNVPPKGTTRFLGRTRDNMADNIYRDSGSSAYANGYHMMIFADTLSAKGPPTPDLIPDAHNSLVYFGYLDKTDPTDLYDFGSQTPFVRETVLPSPMHVKDNSNETEPMGFWPSSNMVALSDGKTVVGLFPLVDIPKQTAIYSSMFTTTLTDPTTMGNGGPQTNRIVDQFFYVNEPMYGGFSVLRGPDNYLYWFAAVIDGVKLARCTEDNLTHRGRWEFYNGKQFSSVMPASSDSSANIIHYSKQALGRDIGPGTGDCFWSNFHATFLCVFMDSGIDGIFYVTYSMTGQITGPWSDAEELYTPDENPTFKQECTQNNLGGAWNYAGHAHPHWDETGRTLLISWSSCMVYIPMATITFEGSQPLPLRKRTATDADDFTSTQRLPTTARRQSGKRRLSSGD